MVPPTTIASLVRPLFRKWGNLALHQVAIDTLASHQHLRRPLLTDLSRLQHHDPIEASQGR